MGSNILISIFYEIKVHFIRTNFMDKSLYLDDLMFCFCVRIYYFEV